VKIRAVLKIIFKVGTAGLVALAAVGCGSSGSSSSHPSPAASTPAAPASSSGSGGGSLTSAAGGSSAGLLSAEARSAATGDIPDNQIFLTYNNPVGKYTMVYPEGWAIKAQGANVTINNNNNIVRVTIVSGGQPSTASVAAGLAKLKRASPSFTFSAPFAIRVTLGPAIRVNYSTLSAPNPVTGKSVLLLVNRYELSNGSKRAIVDLGTPKGVDNVDAYRKMINSFRWQ
jgi:hypothetical protein